MSSSSNRLGNQPLTLVIGVRTPKRMPIGRALKSPVKKTNAGFEPCPLSSAEAIKLRYLPFVRVRPPLWRKVLDPIPGDLRRYYKLWKCG